MFLFGQDLSMPGALQRVVPQAGGGADEPCVGVTRLFDVVYRTQTGPGHRHVVGRRDRLAPRGPWETPSVCTLAATPTASPASQPNSGAAPTTGSVETPSPDMSSGRRQNSAIKEAPSRSQGWS